MRSGDPRVGMVVWRGLPARFPIFTSLFVLACVVSTAPLLVSERHLDAIAPRHDAHRVLYELTNPFVHGPMPPALAHLATNVIVIVWLGTVIERVLGTGRLFLLSFASYLGGVVLMFSSAPPDERSTGASGICWGYSLFAIVLLTWLARRSGWSVLKDPAYLAVVSIVAVMLVGIPLFLQVTGHPVRNSTNVPHATALLVALPLFAVWRRLFVRNLERIAADEAPDRGSPLLARIAIGSMTTVVLVRLGITLAALN